MSIKEVEKKVFQHEMEVSVITRKQTKANGKQAKEEEIMLIGTNCILALRRFDTELTDVADGELLEVIIKRGNKK